MKFGVTVLVLAAITSALFALAMKNNWLRAIFYCEGFGCAGLGILYLGISALIVVVFLICGFLLGPAPRFLSAVYAGCVALVAMFLSFEAHSVHNRLALERGMKAHEKACAEYPQLCPERQKP